MVWGPVTTCHRVSRTRPLLVIHFLGLLTLMWTLAECTDSTSKRLHPDLYPPYSTRANDVWSLTVLLINLSVGRNPWFTATPTDNTFSSFQREPHTALTRILPISRELNDIVRWAFHPIEGMRLSLEELMARVRKVEKFSLDWDELCEAPTLVREAAMGKLWDTRKEQARQRWMIQRQMMLDDHGPASHAQWAELEEEPVLVSGWSSDEEEGSPVEVQGDEAEEVVETKSQHIAAPSTPEAVYPPLYTAPGIFYSPSAFRSSKPDNTFSPYTEDSPCQEYINSLFHTSPTEHPIQTPFDQTDNLALSLSATPLTLEDEYEEEEGFTYLARVARAIKEEEDSSNSPGLSDDCDSTPSTPGPVEHDPVTPGTPSFFGQVQTVSGIKRKAGNDDDDDDVFQALCAYGTSYEREMRAGKVPCIEPAPRGLGLGLGLAKAKASPARSSRTQTFGVGRSHHARSG